MTVREYIGARYVPIFIGDWDNTKTYEPLSIVTNEGNSYTSRQFVPTGIDITNETYWALTGNYNAQVEAYRDEVAQVAASFTEIENTIAPYTSENTIAESITEIENTIAPYTSENTVAEAIANVTDTIYEKYMVCVDQYGAIGDGETDSTDAIQQCIDENPNALIFFKKGVYLITDEIQLYGRNGAQIIELGGSIVKADASIEYCFIFDKDKPALDAYQNGTPIIQNGIVDCNSKANGIMIHDINCDVQQTTIRNPVEWGLYLNNVAESGVSSGNCIIEDCHIENTSPYTNWHTKSGIIVYSMDNKIIDTNIMRFGYAINLHAMGQVISDCHLFAGIFNSVTPSVFKTAAIYINSDATQLDPLQLINNYIDNFYYYIGGSFWGTQFNQTIDIIDGFFLWSNNYGFDLTESYILNPNLTFLVNIDGLTIEENTSLTNFVIYNPVFRDYLGGVINNQVRCKCEIMKSRSQASSLTEYMGQYQMNNDETAFLAADSTTGSNTYIKIGCIVRPLVENSICPVELIFNRAAVLGENKLVIGFNTSNESIILDSNYIGVKTGVKIAVSKAPEATKTIGSTTIGIYPIYIGGVSNSGVIYGAFKANSKTNAVATYIFPQGMQTQLYTLDPNDYIIY